MQNKTTATLFGVDFSSRDSIIDEALLFTNLDFMWCRAYGSDHTGSGDSQTAEFVAAARRNNCPVGCYYFATPFVDAAAGVSTDAQIQANAETQAQQFIDKLFSVFGQGNVGDLIPMMDLEQYKDQTTQYGHTATNIQNYPQAVMTNAQITHFALSFKNYFNTHSGWRLGLYTGEYWIKAPNPSEGAGLTTAQLQSLSPPEDPMPLWVARYDEYNASNDTVPNFGNWTEYVAWQYTGIGNAAAHGIENDPPYTANNYLDFDRAVSLEPMLAVRTTPVTSPTIKVGGAALSKIKLGSADIFKAYLGDINIYNLSVPPVTTISPSTTVQNSIPFTVTLSTSEVGATIYYKLGTGGQQTYTGPFEVNQNSPGVNSSQILITYWAVGANGTETEKTITYNTSGATPGTTTVSATATATQVDLSWTPTANTLSYSVYRSTALGTEGTVLANANYITATSFTDTTVSANTTYYYTVRTNNLNGFIPSAQKAVTTPAAAQTGWRYVKITMYGDNNGYLFRVVEWEVWNAANTTNLIAGKMPFATTNAGFSQSKTTAVCTDGDKNVANRFAFMDGSTSAVATCTYDIGSVQALNDFRMWNYSISGDQRKMKFKIEVSKDNAAWTLVVDYSTNTTIACNTDGKFPNTITFPAG